MNADAKTRESGAPRRRVAVIGDVGGHADELSAELRRLGVDPDTGEVPPELTIVQVGDLVHRGPASEEVVTLVDRCLHVSPSSWIQLVGNHETIYLRRRPNFEWSDRIDHQAIDLLRDWWRRGVMRPAAVVAAAGHELLVTHAGLTEGFWREVLGAPGTAREAAAALDDLVAADDPVLYRGGMMLGGGPPDPAAGPLWASAPDELLPSWAGVELPFGQIHGHSSVLDRSDGEVRVGPDLADLTTFDHDAGHETTRLPGGAIVGIDPGHSDEAYAHWRAWEPSDLGA